MMIRAPAALVPLLLHLLMFALRIPAVNAGFLMDLLSSLFNSTSFFCLVFGWNCNNINSDESDSPTIAPNNSAAATTPAPLISSTTSTQTPTASPQMSPSLPTGSTPRLLSSIESFRYQGSFRLARATENRGVDYAVGTLAYSSSRNSIFIAGHTQAKSVGEYAVPATSRGDTQSDVADLPEAELRQEFTPVLDLAGADHQYDRITGLFCYENGLIINKEVWYDASGSNTETTTIVPDLNDLSSVTDGFFAMNGSANSAGYIGTIPEEFQSGFGSATHYTGWSSVWSIISRYSVGPSLWTFDPNSVTLPNEPPGTVDATAYMNYAYDGPHLSEGALLWAPQGTPGPFTPADPLWNQESRAVYAFFVPGTRTFVAIGSSGGLETGIGYKAVQDDGTVCGGPCPYDATDYTNYAWLYDIETILASENVYSVRPYSYGKWEVPFDNDGLNRIIGGALDEERSVLYIALENAGRVGDFDYAPLIVTYELSNLE